MVVMKTGNIRKGVLAILVLLLCSIVWAEPEYSRYVFDPNQSTIIKSGGIGGVYETYSIRGTFGLVADYDANTAYFTDVDANYVWPANSLGELLEMEELVSTEVTENYITFENVPLIGGAIIELAAGLSGNMVHLTGIRTVPYPDGFQYDLDAIAERWANARCVPQNATSADEVAITVWGRWPDGCIPDDSNVQVENSDIYFEVFSTGGDICPSGLVPWQLTESVGYLGAGTYNVHVNLNGGPWMQVLEFSVASAYYVDGVNGSDDNDGLSLETAFATIQHGIDEANDCDMVLVYPAVYSEAVSFDGKAITVQGVATEAGGPIIEAPMDYTVSFYSDEEPNSVLKNFVVRNSFVGIFLADAFPTLQNLTIVDNDSGIAAYAGAEPDISNCIFYNNTDGDLFGCEARYSWFEPDVNEPNEPNTPIFADADANDYHLLSERGRYWPEHDVWVLDDATSPCVDGGEPNENPTDERMPNGGRVNMGAFGDTAYASMSEWAMSGDVSRDGLVNFKDMAIVAGEWLDFMPWAWNEAPEVSISSPDGSEMVPYNTIDPVIIEADASDIDGEVVKVEFFANGSKVAEDTNGSNGWQGFWHPISDGDFTLTAEATDDDGASTISAAVEVTVGYVL